MSTYQKAIIALRIINPIKDVDGQKVAQKSPLSSLKGKAGTQVYNVKHDLLDACKPLDDRQNDLIKDISAIRDSVQKELVELQELNAKEPKTKKDNERIKEIEAVIDSANERINPINEEISGLFDEEIEITFKKGKLKLADIEDVIDADEREALDFIIEE